MITLVTTMNHSEGGCLIPPHLKRNALTQARRLFAVELFVDIRTLSVTFLRPAWKEPLTGAGRSGIPPPPLSLRYPPRSATSALRQGRRWPALGAARRARRP